MTPACAVITAKQVGQHEAQVRIDSRKCEKLGPGEYYEYPGGLRLTYGRDGEAIRLWRSDKAVLVLTVPLVRGLATLRLEHIREPLAVTAGDEEPR